MPEVVNLDSFDRINAISSPSCPELVAYYNANLHKISVTVKHMPPVAKECSIPVFMVDTLGIVQTYEQIVELPACKYTCKKEPS